MHDDRRRAERDERLRASRAVRRKDLRHERPMTVTMEVGATVGAVALVGVLVVALVAPEAIHAVLSQIGRLVYDIAEAFGNLLRQWGTPSS